jgi:TldD protein
MRDKLTEALKASTADYCEIRLETNVRTRLAYRGGEIETADSSSHAGGIVRACVRGGWGTVTFDSLEGLDQQVREACRCAELVGSETTELADVEPVDVEVNATMERDFRGVALDDKLKLIERYNQVLLTSADKVESTTAVYQDSFRTVWLANSRGAFYKEERPQALCGLVAVARDGSLVQTAFDGVSSTTSYEDVVALDELAQTVARRSAALLTAPQCEGGPQTVVLNNRMAGVFVHEAFGHLSEADFLYENPKLRETMHLGRQMGVQELNIIDDGSIPGKRGSQFYDDEGTPTGATRLITEGVLTGHLHSLETAGKMGAQPTGNARAIGRSYAPIVRMTNTYIDAGATPKEEVFAGIDNGVYACDSFGGQTELEMFTFSAGHGYRIENGQVGELVRDVVLTGNVFETLGRIDAVGDDLEIENTMGGCGKGGQMPLPVCHGAPHVRIRDLLIGG